jgi:hypothetical protein
MREFVTYVWDVIWRWFGVVSVVLIGLGIAQLVHPTVPEPGGLWLLVIGFAGLTVAQYLAYRDKPAEPASQTVHLHLTQQHDFARGALTVVGRYGVVDMSRPSAEDFRGHFNDAAAALDAWNVWSSQYFELAKRRDLAVRDETVRVCGNRDAGLRNLLGRIAVRELRPSGIASMKVSGATLYAYLSDPALDPVALLSEPVDLPEDGDHDAVIAKVQASVTNVLDLPAVVASNECDLALARLRPETEHLLEDAYSTMTLTGKCGHCP